MTDFPIVSSKELTKAQRRQVNRLIRYIRKNSSGSEGRISELEIHQVGSFVSVSLEHTRTDCEEYSPRMYHSTVRVYAHITLRGVLTICSATSGTHEQTEHVAFMLNAGMLTKKSKFINSWHVRNRVTKRINKQREQEKA